MTILCTTNPVCPAHQQFDPAICCSDPNSKFATLADCEERRELILGQASAFVLTAQCYQTVRAPIVRIK